MARSATPLPEDVELAAALGAAKRACSTISSVEPYRAVVLRRVEQGVNAVAIHAALSREHGYGGSYSSVYRMVMAIGATRTPDATVPQYFPPGEAAQVDFGAGPLMHDPAVLRTRRTWCFVMTLCFSRHQYVEFGPCLRRARHHPARRSGHRAAASRPGRAEACPALWRRAA
jgi:hypothetical protein